MSGTPTGKADGHKAGGHVTGNAHGNPTQFMRTLPIPKLPPALETAAHEWISGGDTALLELRTAAFTALQKSGLPDSGSEDFTFVRVGEFLPHLQLPAATTPAGLASQMPSSEDLQRFILPEVEDSYVVLVDGAYVPSLSKHGDEYQIASLAQGISSLPSHLRALLTAAAAEETDAAASLATLFGRAPLLIQIPPKAVLEKPLLLLHIRTGADKPAKGTSTSTPISVPIGPRHDALVVIHSGKQSQARILVRHALLAKTGSSENKASSTAANEATALSASSAEMENVHTLAILEEAAALTFLEAGSDEGIGSNSSTSTTNLPNRDIHFRKLTARLDRSSRLLAVSAHTGSRLTRNAFAVDLAGEGAEADVNGAAVLTGSKQSHNFLRIRHLVPHCLSRQHFKSVAADTSRSSVEGTIFVAKHAQQTNAYQLINNLMLSDEARADSKPRLMIYADDVKCSHGATSGKLDQAQQFYLESRGLTPKHARALLTVAFIAEVLEKSGKSDKAGNANNQADGFRTILDHALLDTLRHRLPDAPLSKPKSLRGNGNG